MHESTDAPAPASGQTLRLWDASTGTWKSALDWGDGWIVDNAGKVWLWDASANRWTNVGATRRPEGTPGATPGP